MSSNVGFNINALGLLQVLTNEETKVNTEYLKEDYKLLAEKIKQYHSAKGILPTKLMLKAKAKSFGNDKVEGDRLVKIAESLLNLENELSDREVSDLLLDDYKKRKILEITEGIIEATINEDWNDIEELNDELQRVKNLSNDMDTWLVDDDKKLIPIMKNLELNSSTGIITGERDALSDIVLGSLILVGAPSGIGKSLFSLSMMMNKFLLDDANVLYISYELPRTLLYNRIKSYITKVPIEEITNGEYLLEESKLKMKVVDYVITKKVLLNDAIEIYKKDGIEGLQKLPDRKNTLKIIASIDKSMIDIAKQHNQKIEELPNEKDLINIMDNYGYDLDCVFIDMLAEVPFSDNRLSREQNLTNISRTLKLKALKYSTNIYVLTQLESESEIYGLFSPKYSRGLKNISDLFFNITYTKQMKEDNEVGVSVIKARHHKSFETYYFESDYSTQTFSYLGDKVSMGDYMEELRKSLSGKNKKKG